MRFGRLASHRQLASPVSHGLPLRSKYVSCFIRQTECGTVPVSLLLRTSMCVSCVRLEISAGIVP